MNESENPLTVDYLESHFNFQTVKKITELLTSPEEQLRYLYKMLAEFHQFRILNHINDKKEFSECCDWQIWLILHLLELQPYNDGILPSPFTSPEFNQNKRVIADLVYNVDILHWKYVFISEKDHCQFLTIFSAFFTGLPVVHHVPIYVQARCKIRLSQLIKQIYETFCTIPLRKNPEFLRLVKNISIYANFSDSELCVQLTKNKPVM